MARVGFVLKTGSRKTSIPRKEIRRVMEELFGKKPSLSAHKKKSTKKKAIRKTTRHKLS
jgi:hypothetical protein